MTINEIHLDKDILICLSFPLSLPPSLLTLTLSLPLTFCHLTRARSPDEATQVCLSFACHSSILLSLLLFIIIHQYYDSFIQRNIFTFILYIGRNHLGLGGRVCQLRKVHGS